MGEDVAPLRSNTLSLGGMRSTKNSSVRHTEPRGHTKEPLIPPRHSTHSSSPPPYTPRRPNGFILKTEEEEEDMLVYLEKRLEPNVDFDDALHVLDSTWISNLDQPWMGVILYGVGVNTHKELDSEVLIH
jgi:hypothetical protein